MDVRPRSFPGSWGSSVPFIEALNWCIHRMPAHKSICGRARRVRRAAPRSRRGHNVPVLSWVWLRAAAPRAGRRSRSRYPIVEALTGRTFAVAWLRFGPVGLAAALVSSGALVSSSRTR